MSIIICTRDRADHLRATLQAIGALDVPVDLPAEVVVVDNGSSDDTEHVVRGFAFAHLPVRYVKECRKGKGHAYNAGIASAAGELFLFTDDDVRPPRNWIEAMCRPVASGKADAVAGGVRIPEHLERSWLTGFLRGWVACTERMMQTPPPPDYPLIGANMAFSRRVLEKVPAFDPELGPGALGFGEETLFSYQLHAAGYRTLIDWDVRVEHHFDPARLTRASFENDARKRGCTQAYLYHHWEHWELRFPYLQYLFFKAKLAVQQIRHWRSRNKGEPQPWEMSLLYEMFVRKHYRVERRRPRNYARHGLVKQTAFGTAAPGGGVAGTVGEQLKVPAGAVGS